MQIENDYDQEVYNGDISYVDDVDPDSSELTASFDGRAVVYGFGELDTLVPALPRMYWKEERREWGSRSRTRAPVPLTGGPFAF